MPTRTRIYVEANCLIDAAKVEIKGAESIRDLSDIRHRDVWMIQQILRAARAKDLEVFTSTISIAECSHIGEKPPEGRVKQLFESVLLSGQCLKLVESDVFVCADARDLIWDHGISLKGADAIHVASACSANCEELLTTDKDILKHVARIKAAVNLKVLHPAETQLLPDDYRQGQLLLTE